MVGDDDRQQKRTRGDWKEVGTGSAEEGGVYHVHCAAWWWWCGWVFCLYVENVKARDRVRQGKEAAFWTLQDCFSVPWKAELYKKLSSAFRLGFFPFWWIFTSNFDTACTEIFKNIFIFLIIQLWGDISYILLLFLSFIYRNNNGTLLDISNVASLPPIW